MQGNFESIENASSKDGVIRVEHVNDVKGDVLCAGVLRGTKGNMQGYYSDWFDSFAAKAVEGLPRFFELLLVITHFLKAVWKRI
jgi:hypothetical protein